MKLVNDDWSEVKDVAGAVGVGCGAAVCARAIGAHESATSIKVRTENLLIPRPSNG